MGFEKHSIVGFCCCAFLIVASVLTYTSYTIQTRLDEYESVDCRVISIDYPKVSPQINDTLWGSCNCGRRCKAYTPIINLNVKLVNDSNIYLLKHSENDKYTFFNSSCSKGEKLNSINTFINNARAYFIKYNNKTMSVYFNGEYVLIEKETLYENLEFITLLAFSIILCIFCFCVFIHCLR